MPNFQNLQNCRIFGPIIHFMDTKFYNKWFGPKNTIFGITNIYQASQIYQSFKFKPFLSFKDFKSLKDFQDLWSLYFGHRNRAL